MVPNMNSNRWSKEIEEDLILLIKDWLRQTGRTQSELCQSLNLSSSRIPTLIDFLKNDFISGGIPKIANRLCEIESSWTKGEVGTSKKKKRNNELNTTSQLDLLDEICEDLSKITFNN
jgi:predicted XRE-type DNA-binding protein